MIAIFLRELRNNGKWAVLAMLLLAATLALVSANALAAGGFPVLVHANMDVATSLGFPACGFVLGLLATLPDAGVGQWALLTHRPIRRWRIFLAKLMAAVTLYLLAAGGPLAGLIFWSATPGNVAAPFAWAMALPRLAHLLVGITWLAAGMLVAAREARWMGSRLVAAGGAAAGSAVLATWNVTPIEAFVIPAVGALALAAAAMGAFSAGGEYEAQPWAGRILGATAVGTAFVAGGFAVVWLPLLLSRYMPPFLFRVPQDYLAYELDNHGDVYRLDRSWIGSIENGHETYTDMTGDAPASTDISTDQVVLARPTNTPTGLFDAGSYAQVLDSNSRRRHWFFLPRQRTVEGFDIATRRYVGSLGPDGFAPAGKPAQPFPGPLSLISWPWPDSLPPLPGIFFDPHRVWDLDLSDEPGTYSLFDVPGWIHRRPFTSPADDPIQYITPWTPGSLYPNKPEPLKLIVACQSSVSIVEQDVPPIRIETGMPISATSAIWIVRRGDGGYSLLLVDYQTGWPIRTTAAFIRADRHGRVLARSDLPELSFVPSAEPAWQSVMDLLALPPVLLVGLAVVRHGPDTYSWFTLASLSMALISALAGRLLLRRYATTAAGRWGWTICCGLLGVVGLLTLLCTRTAVTRVPCPKCLRRRLVTQERCEHCGARFSPPPRTGVEVFEENQLAGAAR